jgi:DnaJ-domain-containing protein 1
MSIWSRLGSVINSYLNEFESETSRSETSRSEASRSYKSSGDPDLDAAYDELNEFLNRKDTHSNKEKAEYTWKETNDNRKTSGKKLPPQELRADFELLGVPFGADMQECRAAYKKLLKIHHPDRHAGHEGNFKKATAKSAKINAAWDRIGTWHTKEGN